MPETYWLETLGCPKNQVDSDKLVGTLVADGYERAGSAEEADLVVVNTCAFIEAARQESIDTILDLAEARRADSRLVVTGCLAERYGSELSEALPEVDLVAGFGVPVTPAAAQRLRPAQPAPSGGQRTVGLYKGGRGLRPALRLLRHPVLPGPAAVPSERRPPRRGDGPR